MPDPEFVKIIHPASGNIAEVPRSSLAAHYAAGWAPLDESPEAETPPVSAPDPVRAPAVTPEPAWAPAATVTPDTSTEENE